MIERLIEGFRNFRQTYYAENRALFDALAQGGQSPRAMVISCCDSRVDPALIFGAEPGDMFVLRNVANLVPPYSPDAGYHGTSAALEFAVRSLKVEHIVVMGHARCGGVRALLDPHAGDSTDFLGSWMDIAHTARDAALAHAGESSAEDLQRACEHATISVSLANLMTFPWIKAAVEAGTLSLHGWYFDIESGQLSWLDDADGSFHPV
jgi:carbonic anhydrase